MNVCLVILGLGKRNKMVINCHIIFGFNVGMEIADKQDCEEFNMDWAIDFSLGIVRFTFIKTKE